MSNAHVAVNVAPQSAAVEAPNSLAEDQWLGISQRRILSWWYCVLVAILGTLMYRWVTCVELGYVSLGPEAKLNHRQ